MICEEIRYTDRYSAPRLVRFSTTDTMEPKVRDTVVVLPGGGYHNLAAHEGEPIALAYVAEGFNAFVLYYGIKENARFPGPLAEVSLAIKHIRDHAEEYGVDPERIFILGSSAGGHLAASLGTLGDDEDLLREAGIRPGENRVAGQILVYPLISGDPAIWHRNSFRFLTGMDQAGLEEPDRALCEKYSLERHVTPSTAPTFIWSTCTDKVVPVQNTIRYIEALADAHVPFEAHVFPTGRHGMGLASVGAVDGKDWRVNAAAAAWFAMSVRWMRDLPRPSDEA